MKVKDFLETIGMDEVVVGVVNNRYDYQHTDYFVWHRGDKTKYDNLEVLSARFVENRVEITLA